jgi:hypothetical protein
LPFRQESPTESPQVLELWTNGGQALLRRIVLPAKLHGKVISDVGGFGRPSWNADETLLVYTAERNIPETVSFFADSGGGTDKNDGSNSNSKIRGGTNTLGLYLQLQLDLLSLTILRSIGRRQDSPP